MSKIMLSSVDDLGRFIEAAHVVLQHWEYLADATHRVDLTLPNGDELRVDPRQGLCDWVEQFLDWDDLSTMYAEWEHFSGSVLYPVGGEFEYCVNDNLYQNPLRRELLEWVLQCVTEHLAAAGGSDE